MYGHPVSSTYDCPTHYLGSSNKIWPLYLPFCWYCKTFDTPSHLCGEQSTSLYMHTVWACSTEIQHSAYYVHVARLPSCARCVYGSLPADFHMKHTMDQWYTTKSCVGETISYYIRLHVQHVHTYVHCLTNDTFCVHTGRLGLPVVVTQCGEM